MYKKSAQSVIAMHTWVDLQLKLPTTSDNQLEIKCWPRQVQIGVNATTFVGTVPTLRLLSHT